MPRRNLVLWLTFHRSTSIGRRPRRDQLSVSSYVPVCKTLEMWGIATGKLHPNHYQRVIIDLGTVPVFSGRWVFIPSHRSWFRFDTFLCRCLCTKSYTLFWQLTSSTRRHQQQQQQPSADTSDELQTVDRVWVTCMHISLGLMIYVAGWNAQSSAPP